MSRKRASEIQLSRDNWDNDDNNDQDRSEDENEVKDSLTPVDTLKNRVIIKAKRRISKETDSGNTEKPSIFSGFKGFSSFGSSTTSNGNGGLKFNFDSINKKTADSETTTSTTAITTTTITPTFKFGTGITSTASLQSNKTEPSSTLEAKKDDETQSEIKKLNSSSQKPALSLENKDDKNKDVQDSSYYSRLIKLNKSFLEHLNKYSTSEKLVWDFTLVCQEYIDKCKKLQTLKTKDDNITGGDLMKSTSGLASSSQSTSLSQIPQAKKQEDESESKSTPTTSIEIEKPKSLLSSTTTTKEESSSSLFQIPTNPKTSSSLFSFSSNDDKSTKSSFFSGFASSTTTTSTKSDKTFGSLFGSTTTNTIPAFQNIFAAVTNRTAEPQNKTETDSATGDASEGTSEAAEEPPKVSSVEHLEADSVYTKKCRLYYKKNEDFVEKGIGFLYIKCKDGDDNSIPQLLIRADTRTGNILLNIALCKTLPIQKAEKKGILLTCIPNPPIETKKKKKDEKDDDDDKKSVTYLVRVKATDCDELYQNIMKYRK